MPSAIDLAALAEHAGDGVAPADAECDELCTIERTEMPLHSQQDVEREAEAWAVVWQTKAQPPMPLWPAFLGGRPAQKQQIQRTLLAGAIIYCDGYKSALRGPFTYLPWQPAKGEALTLRSDVPDKPFILNREGWALPLGQGVWRTGTNWQWDQLDETPTELQKEKLIGRFRGYFGQDVSVEVTAHIAGVRPCTSDNHPFMGTHPTEAHTHLFGGLGPRGTVWAPAMADEMAAYLCEGRALRPECNLSRFASPG